MCRFKSYVVTKDLKVHGLRRTCSHEEILASINQEDLKNQDTIQTREFVRVEVTPKNAANMTRNIADWTYHEDEQDTLPEWYHKNKARIEQAVYAMLVDDLKVQLVLKGESANVTNTEIFLFDSSTVEARDSSKVVAWDSSTVEALDSSKVEIKSAYAVVLSKGKIFVNPDAKVIFKSTIKAQKA